MSLLQSVFPVSYLEPPAAQRYLGDAVIRDLPAVAAVQVLQLRTQLSDGGQAVVSNLQGALEQSGGSRQGLVRALSATHLAVAELQLPECVAVQQQGPEPGGRWGGVGDHGETEKKSPPD